MDLDDDGRVDILSGSYCAAGSAYRKGLFQVLRGTSDGGFAAARPLLGTDGAPLAIDAPTPRDYCTRPSAADLDGDGRLDIVSGNFTGQFVLFAGEGNGGFAPRGTWLTDTTGSQLMVDGKSDPFFIDWDADGDLDMLSGSGRGGVYLFTNSGTSTSPQFEARLELVPRPEVPEPGPDGQPRPGIDHITGPQTFSRVWAGDVDDDGDLDLLVGDTMHVRNVFPEFTAEQRARHEVLRAELKAIDERSAELYSEYRAIDEAKVEARSAVRSRIDELSDRYRAVQDQLPQEYEGAGFVWLYRGK